MAEHDLERAVVEREQRVEAALEQAREPPRALVGARPQEEGAHHGRERQRQQRRDADGDGERDGELAEEAPDDAAHEEQRDQHGDQRDRERDDGEADLLRALERRLERPLTSLDVAGDVLDHHDGVVDHEAGRDGEGHQRQVVQAVAAEVHQPEGAMSESGTATPGMMVARQLRRKR